MWEMAAIQGATSIAGAAIQANAKTMQAPPMTPNQQSSNTDQIFDNSGWTVATGGSNAAAEKSEGLQLGQWALVALAAVLVVGVVRGLK